MDREKKLEEGMRAAMRLRKAIEAEPSPPLEVGVLLVPIEAVREFDRRMDELKKPS